MAKLIHSMIRVMDEEKSTKFYQDVLGLTTKERYDFDTFTLIYLKNDQSNFELELTVNKGREEAYTHGTGYGHLAVAVDNLEEEHARLSAMGVAVQDIVEFKGTELSAKFFFITDPDGYKIEVLQKMGRYR